MRNKKYVETELNIGRCLYLITVLAKALEFCYPASDHTINGVVIINIT
jgi:hypothetical protein